MLTELGTLSQSEYLYSSGLLVSEWGFEVADAGAYWFRLCSSRSVEGCLTSTSLANTSLPSIHSSAREKRSDRSACLRHAFNRMHSSLADGSNYMLRISRRIARPEIP